jgi:parvulin-like peptidyl-prolyl isomerase
MKQMPLVATAIAGLLLAAAPVVTHAEIFEQVLVKVNGEIFTKSDLESRQVAVLRQRNEPFDVKGDKSNQRLRQALNEITPGIMVGAVDEMLVVQRGRELGYKLSDDQFNSVVGNIRKENKLESEEQFQAALKQEGLTVLDLRRNLERQMIAQRVQQNEVFGKVGVTDEEARAYYNAHINEFTTPPTVTLREILVSAPTEARLTVAQDEAARARADTIRARATGGEDFAKLASDISESPSRANGGLIGPLSLKDLAPDLRKLIEAMKVGDISAVLRTPRGYQILKLETSTGAETLAFDQAREQISDRVFTDKRKDEYQKYLQKLRAQAIIDWRNPELQKAYEEGLKQGRALAQ